MKMKIQRILKGRGIRAILCGLASVLCIVSMSLSVRAEVHMEDFPSVYLSPDGTAWTTYDELPYYESYHTTGTGSGNIFSFWTNEEETIPTGEASRKVDLGVGQHYYNFERRGEVPVLYWEVTWRTGKCIHNGVTYDLLGITNMDTYKCGDAYWSGLMPYCAYCERSVSEYLHYIKPETAAQINWLDLDMGYFYLCPHGENHTGVKLEQAIDEYHHVLLAYLV